MGKKDLKPVLLKDCIGAHLILKEGQFVPIWRNFGKMPKFKKKGAGLIEFYLNIIIVLIMIIVIVGVFPAWVGFLDTMFTTGTFSPIVRYILVFGAPFLVFVSVVYFSIMLFRGGTTG
jgi:hypothetical protein